MLETSLYSLVIYMFLYKNFIALYTRPWHTSQKFQLNKVNNYKKLSGYESLAEFGELFLKNVSAGKQ